MFDLFPSQWTPVLFARELKRKPVRARVAGVDIVLFRGKDGAPSALVDRCPHRGVALSLGRIDDDGRIECPFHGWAFDGDGKVQNVPLNDVKPNFCERGAADALPCLQRGGFIWVFTEVGAVDVEPPFVSDDLLRNDIARYDLSDVWATHWTRAMENMLDAPHLPYVHRTTIGAGLRKPALEGDVMKTYAVDDEHGFWGHWELKSGKPNTSGKLRWLRPNGMVLPLGGAKRLYSQHLYVVPVDDNHCRMMISSVRDFGRYNPLLKPIDWFNHYILLQDKAVVESSQPAEVPDASDEVSVASDAPTLAFRKWYRGWRRSLTSPAVQLHRGDDDVTPAAASSASV